MERIVRISNCELIIGEEKFDSFQVVTDLQTIIIGISSTHNFCECSGILTISNDYLYSFIGSYLKSITIVENALMNNSIDLLYYIHEKNSMIVNIETSNGVLQIVAYNIQEEDYAEEEKHSHKAVLISNQLNHSACF